MMMLRNIALGVYYPGNSLLHRLQARTKLLLLFCVIVWLILASHNLWHFAPYIAVVALICVSAIISGIALRDLARRMSILIALAIISVLSGLFRLPEPGDRLLATIGPLVTTYSLVHTIALTGGAALLAFVLSSLLPLPLLRALWRRPGSALHAWPAHHDLSKRMAPDNRLCCLAGTLRALLTADNDDDGRRFDRGADHVAIAPAPAQASRGRFRAHGADRAAFHPDADRGDRAAFQSAECARG